jgi:hypothetical protein
MIATALAPQSGVALASTAPAQVVSSASDTLILPQSTRRVESLLPAITSTPTATATSTTPAFKIKATATPTATPQPFIPAGQGIFKFHNPTGHDLVVDLTGSTSASALVPPYTQHEFLLGIGPYQYMVHTPTGAWLASTKGVFDLSEGQVVEKDYYSDYDWSQQQ